VNFVSYNVVILWHEIFVEFEVYLVRHQCKIRLYFSCMCVVLVYLC